MEAIIIAALFTLVLAAISWNRESGRLVVCWLGGLLSLVLLIGMVVFVAHHKDGNHTSMEPWLLASVFLPTAIVGSRDLWRSRMGAGGLLAVLFGVSGLVYLTYIDVTNRMLSYNTWIKRGMPSLMIREVREDGERERARSGVRPEWYELRNALEQGDPDAAAELLRKDPSLIDARNGIGETVLHFLAVEDNLHAVEWLHSRGAGLNVVNQFGTPVLFEVAMLGYRDLFLWLIRNGADHKKRNEEGETLAEYLKEFDKDDMLAFIKEHVATEDN